MFHWKNKKTNHTTKQEFNIVKSYYGMAQHISLRDTPLCGYDNGLPTNVKWTKKEIFKAHENAHDGFFFCTTCIQELENM